MPKSSRHRESVAKPYNALYNVGSNTNDRLYYFPSNLNIHNDVIPSVLYIRQNKLRNRHNNCLQAVPPVLHDPGNKLVIFLPPFDHSAPYFHYKIYDGADYSHDDLAYGFERYSNALSKCLRFLPSYN